MNSKRWLIFIILLMLLSTPLSAQQLYRWVDDEGNVQFSDRLPPEAADRGRTEMSRDGMRRRDVPPPKTAEELRRERELERLRREQAELIEQQRRADEVLLRTYRSVDDVVMMRDGKIAAVDVMIQSLKGDIRRQQNQINRAQREAAEQERAGQTIHENTEREIRQAKASIEDTLALILRHERTKQDLFEQYANELERFTRLRNIRMSPLENEEQARYSAELENLVECDTQRDCARLWGRTLGYVEQHATQSVESSSERVIITSAPTADDEIGLIATRIDNADDDGAVIFLDIQCASYSVAVSACRTPERVAVLNGFRKALLGDAQSE